MMMTITRVTTVFVLAAVTITGIASGALGAQKPLKVYILAGQSNMEGHAKVETFDYIGDDSATAPLLKEMRSADGKPRICETVWITYLTGSPDRDMLGEGFGKLTAGYGSRRNPTEDGGKIGPEFTFGITMEKAYDGPILIIKTAWGGKSLHTDFRPPSAGPYKFGKAQLEKLEKQGKDIDGARADKAKATGRYYRLMMDHVSMVLKDIKRVYPEYDPKQGYEIAGFAWFQGWNDMVAGNTYPDRRSPGGYDLYSKLMTHFIRDVRKDLSTPKLPFVIGVMGVNGVQKEPNYFRQAMAAPAALPEFKGNVVAVETAPFWDKPLAAIADKNGQIRQLAYQLKKGTLPAKVAINRYPIAYSLRKAYWDTPVEDRSMTRGEQKAYVEEYRAKLITSEEGAMWKRGASNAGYHYLGCGKTMALIGRALADATLAMEKK
jgi:alpha-galactosidase